MRVDSIHVTNYRCFDDFSLSHLGRFVCLVGANGSGKSSILELVVQFSRSEPDPIGAFANEEWSARSGTRQLDITVRLSEAELKEKYPGSELIMPGDELQTLVSCSIAGDMLTRRHDDAYLRVMAKKVVFYSPNRSFIIPDSSEELRTPEDGFYRQVHTPSFQNRAQFLVSQLTTLLRRQHSSLAEVVKEMAAKNLPYPSNAYKELSEVQGVFDRFFRVTGKRFASPLIQNDGRPLFLFTVPWLKYPLPISKLSSGEQWILLFLVELELYKWNESVILIDEIETHLHPWLAAQLVKVLWEREDNNQYWFTTHSPEVALQVARLQSESGERPSMIGLVLDPKSYYAKTIPSDSLELLRSLAGSSAMIPVAATVVLLEGTTVERQRYSVDETLFVELQSCRLIPEDIGFHSVGHSASVEGYEEKLSEVAQKLGVGWRLYAVRDRDALTDDKRVDIMKKSQGRLWIWERSSLEGYLVEPELMVSYLAKQNTDPAPTVKDIRTRLMDLLSHSRDETIRRYENQVAYHELPPRSRATSDWLRNAPTLCKGVDSQLSSFRKAVDEWLKKNDWASLLRYADCKKVLEGLVGSYTGKGLTKPDQLAELVRRIVRDVIASRDSSTTPEATLSKLWPEISEVVSKMKQGLGFDYTWTSH